MIAGPQQKAIALLMDSASHRSSEPVEQIETHISRIFLAGDRAYKMKRAVKLPYVDFSTPELRLAACEKEVELNSRTAPGLYLGVRRITRETDGKLVFDGDGEMVDAVVEMVRFDQSKLLDRMAMAGALTPALMTEVARMIVRFHRGAPSAAHHVAEARTWPPCSTSTRRALPPAMLCRKRNHALRRGVPRRARALRIAARSPRGRGQGAPLPWRSASAQHLPARR